MTLARFLMLAAVAAFALATLPAATAATPAPDAAVNCVTLYDFPDNGEKLCWDLGASGCKVWEVRTTFIGTETNCIVGGGETAQSGVDCYEVYSRTDVGTYSVVRRNSCAPPEIYSCPSAGAPISSCDNVLGLSAESASIDCYYVYSRTDVGTYSVVRRSSCAPPEVYECPYEGAPISQCHGVLDDLLRPAADSAPPCYPTQTRIDHGTLTIYRRDSCSAPQVLECPYPHAPISECQSPFQATVTESAAQECLEYYQDWTVGPVHHVQQDSCHSSNSICGTEEGAFIAQQGSSPDPVGLASCTADSLGLVAASGSPLHRTCYHEGQGELQSEDCVDPTSTSCTVYMQRSTGVSSDWWCYPSMQHGGWD